MKQFNYSLVQRLILYSCGLLLAIWLLIGCNPVQESVKVDSVTAIVLTNTSVPQTVVLLAESATIVSTSTPLPFPSRTNTLPPPTPTSVQLPTPTPKPTLTKDEEGLFVQELMSTNGGCQLPCWWGINLGNTLTSVGNMFLNWGVGPWRVTNSSDETGYIDLGYYEPTISFDSISVFLQFYALDGIVRYIKVSGSREFEQFGEQEYVRDWEKYSLSSLLQTHGKPSQGYLRPGNVADPGPTNYTLLLYYPHLGINVAYTLRANRLTDEIDEVCFALENVILLQLALYDPEFAENWPAAQLLGLGSDYEAWEIENQIGMDLDTFYQTYQDFNNLGCIQITP